MPFSLPAMRRDELLSQPVASDQGREASAGKDQPVIGSKQKRSGHSTQGSVSGNYGLRRSPGFSDRVLEGD